jgi:Uma2 family endonuclease
MSVQTELMTVEEFWERYVGQPYELVQGRAVEVTPSGIQASVVGGNVFAPLHAFVRAHKLGIVTMADGGFRLTPNDLRAPDVAFIGNAKLQELADPTKYAPFAPDLAVEIVSPGNTASEMREKVDIYLATGAHMVWVVYPDLRKVDVHLADGTARTIAADGTLDGGAVLPGFSLPVADLFLLETNVEE